MNKKGFMMAELVVVSAIILVTLTGMYASYNKIYSIYKARARYYDVTTLYRLGYYRDILRTNNILKEAMEESVSGVFLVYDSNGPAGSVFALPPIEQPSGVQDIVYMVNNKGVKIDRSFFSGKNLHVTFLEYVDFLENSVDFSKFNYMMIMERCTPGDENACSYAYLEIPNEYLATLGV